MDILAVVLHSGVVTWWIPPFPFAGSFVIERRKLRNRITGALILCLVLVIEASGQGHWQRIAQPTTNDLLRESFLDSLRGWAVGRGGTIVKTTTGGINWTQQNSGVTGDINSVFMLNNTIGWATNWVYFQDTNTFYGTRILKTTDGGTTWIHNDFPVNAIYFHKITFFDSLNGWVGGLGGSLYQTTDGGTTWAAGFVEPSIYSPFPILNIRFFSREFGFAMGGSMDIVGVLWKTNDGGQKWTAKGVSPEPVIDIHYVDSLNIIGMVGDYDFGSSMIRTSDGGESWNYRFLEIFGIPRGMSFRTPNEAWVPSGNKFLVTYDTARTWLVSDTLSGRQILDVVFTDSLTGFIVTDSGLVFKYIRPLTGSKENITVLPMEPRLMQNYPNPFNPATTSRFSISSTIHVKLKIFDATGREVVTLVNSTLPPGEHESLWSAENFASGIYTYRLQVGSVIRTKKMLLLK
jgi:photosystem II stability/assembly factor-like uncharacterized protein